MRLHLFIPTAALACSLLTPAHAQKTGGDDNTKNDPSPSSTGPKAISSPTYAHTIDDAIQELMEGFPHSMTSLHDSIVRHPFFSHPRFVGSKPFSTWGSFASLTRWSPRYEVIDDAKSFQVKMNVPGFHFHEMEVELESGGRVLSISGTKESNIHEHKTSKDDENNGDGRKAGVGEKAGEEGDEREGGEFEYRSHSSSSFQQKFSLDPSIDTSQMTANLVNGVLEVRAPRKHGAWNGKHIPITQFDEDTWAELMAADENTETEEGR
mmetsp:Transcript_904/g.1939  ORF Transcript_904/g.1939 Transcript_904/m.1939 type:complete len:266 (+) Transcript_904:3-800(+)